MKKMRAGSRKRLKLNNEGVALIYVLIAGTVAMIFCLMLLMVSYNLFTQVSGNTADIQMKLAAETFEEALRSELEAAPDSTMVKYINEQIQESEKAKIEADKAGTDYEAEPINLLIYYDGEYKDNNSMGNYCIYLTLEYEVADSDDTEGEDISDDTDTELSTDEETVNLGKTDYELDATIRCIRSRPYEVEGQEGQYEINDSQSYTVKNTYSITVFED
ncbi:MAG: hypothetical protein K6E98_04210 [Lachnospiraceae bacterium]|nr:hypothetical protein [Lachnospiraceae bacterium]